MQETPDRRTYGAFTLVELLVVVGLMILVISFAAPAVTGLSKGNNLTTAGRVVSNLLTIARSEAINRRALIRFEIATNWPADSSYAYRKFTLVQHDVATGTDTQLTGWETLPNGTVFQSQDPAAGNTSPIPGTYFFLASQTQNPPLTVGQQSVTTRYIEFTPTGALNVGLQASPVRLRVSPGFFDSGKSNVVPTSNDNWYDASIDALIGRIKLSRP